LILVGGGGDREHVPMEKDFVPAFALHALTPLYDPLTRITLPMKRALVERAGIGPGMNVLDFGCGSGALALLVKSRFPTARVVGVDVDPRILEVARRKIASAGVEVELVQGRLGEVELEPGMFDRVLSTFVFHHLTAAEKREAVVAIRRLLRPGGSVHIADVRTRLLGGRRALENALLGSFLRDVGFDEVRERPGFPTVWTGRVSST
jgi:ubiquinone/menaquinone biosynthesis C-methylase UbiE